MFSAKRFEDPSSLFERKPPISLLLTKALIIDKDAGRIYKFGAKVLSGVLVVYVQQAGGGWAGDVLVVDLGEIGNAQYC